MGILYFFESIRNTFLDILFSGITILGEKTVFMAVGMIIFWCVNKYQGYYLLMTGFFGTIINQFLKITCRIPRPWVLDPNFTIVESAREAATGYSFPSGHTQSSVGIFGGIARYNKSTALRLLCIAACILVPISRMYLGVHTPLDVGVSVAAALIIIFGAYPLFMKAQNSPKVMTGILGVLFAVSAAFLLFVELYAFPENIDAHNLLSAQKNAYTLFGCMIGMIITYVVDIKFTHFETGAAWWAQVIKTVLGILFVITVKEGLKAPLDFIFRGHLAARGVRYFLVVIVAGVLWPMTFKFFSRLTLKPHTQAK